ncbi:methylenetetrahydrofolate reductase (NAD(P)H) met13 [Exophiala dermatitidis]|uniref:Methylenetetrahydrofolate reductase (NADPH) n=2 Tax=Exophiala dermatitidis TaxID=5970 RepID=H6C648_EXODN|nr:methylenetetrahydrofolate reductase (NADPH) [Exophiala dermatitidis NIH/UT8656]KAJ4523020.1 methylenetetrahydrofolate reductase (NAD(P)H) met13 [Exophiala dermatitidis]EHY59194.1 methylenetetrahydrofolate reductase (NADPH) [Exophiala dermatitidis NIH/UT8656]KAJ4526342.1 methylenetetrahydrofolate reductase (NAD(P)H) met13 [Exophiala dermatitidis]KAJ4526715.1 methylenetetrahydrofolate reductase (NAD(P)H) met13 [Exophiala dermatitidis]KAJ4532419.1 methylenetetrahydrofolate reductase (NAD(P)H) 
MHISQKLAQAHENGKPTFSFEFFPPKTAQGVQNLYDRMDRMHDLGPAFIDITWGAGGRHSQLTCEMVNAAQSHYGLETCMHLTCTDMERTQVDEALRLAYKAGCTNILALRGDPPRDQEKWEAKDAGFRYAKDLVRYIRARYGDHFDIGVAGYPEGCDDHRDVDLLIEHLKEKVDAGATFVVTQMFYDVDIFLNWVQKCRNRGINVPILPGIMPISTYAAFIRRANWTKCHVPPEWYEALEPVKNDDAAVRDIGKDLVAQMCRRILDAGIHHLHFYTMNLAQATRMILEELALTPEKSGRRLEKPLPWRQSLGFNRRDETVRPIFWRNRNTSYVARTADWDEFPNGRWGDSRSPAFGELDAYGVGLKGTNEANMKLWGRPKSLRDVTALFVRYLQGELERLPWSEGSISAEADTIKPDLTDLNQRGLLTVNSQPAIDGAPSSHPVYGWGPPGGWVYQKAYLELLIFPSIFNTVLERLNANKNLTYYAVNKKGELHTNTKDEGPNAVTWGIFPNREIVQPTIVETVSFLAWKDEAFRLGQDWSRCYPAGSGPRKLIEKMMDECYLVNIVNNDFHQTHEIFRVFDGLEVQDLDVVFEDSPATESSQATTNGNGTRDVLKGDAPVSEVEKSITNGDGQKVPFQTNGVALSN